MTLPTATCIVLLVQVELVGRLIRVIRLTISNRTKYSLPSIKQSSGENQQLICVYFLLKNLHSSGENQQFHIHWMHVTLLILLAVCHCDRIDICTRDHKSVEQMAFCNFTMYNLHSKNGICSTPYGTLILIEFGK